MTALLIHGGYGADGAPLDVVAVDGVISEVGAGLSAPPGASLVDAGGRLLLPGAVDPHVHFNAPGARSHWEGWDTGSAAAAAGGITTVVEMPLNASPPTVDADSFAAKAVEARTRSHVDFGLWGGVIPGNRGALAGLADAGVIGFKAFMSGSGSADFPAADDLTLYEAMATIVDLERPLLLHAESDRITADLAARAVAEGRTGIRDYLDSRPPAAETEAIARALELAAITGCVLHIVHVSTRRGVELVQRARAGGQDVSCELTAHHLCLDEADALALGPVAKCAPPLRDRTEVEALWERLAADDSLFVVSDHSPAPPELKRDQDFFAVWGGIAGVQSTVELMVSEADLAGGGRLPGSALPRALAGAAARRFALPGKGALAAGMDADVAVLEVGPRRRLAREELLDRHRLSAYVERELRARVHTVVLRGEVVYRDGAVVGPPRGRLITPADAPSPPAASSPGTGASPPRTASPTRTGAADPRAGASPTRTGESDQPMGTIVPGDRGRRGLTYTLLTPANRYMSRLPSLAGAEFYKLVTPRLAPARLGEYLIVAGDAPVAADVPPGFEHFLFGLSGQSRVAVDGQESDLSNRGFAYLGPAQFFSVALEPGASLIAIKRRYEPWRNLAEPAPVTGRLADVPRSPTAVPGLHRRELVDPADPAFDFNISHMEFDPDVALAQIEIHDEEHGLYMTSGGGLYHLDGEEHPVLADDFIYMAPYCPQSFRAGPDGGAYLLYKDVYRDGF